MWIGKNWNSIEKKNGSILRDYEEFRHCEDGALQLMVFWATIRPRDLLCKCQPRESNDLRTKWSLTITMSHIKLLLFIIRLKVKNPSMMNFPWT